MNIDRTFHKAQDVKIQFFWAHLHTFQPNKRVDQNVITILIFCFVYCQKRNRDVVTGTVYHNTQWNPPYWAALEVMARVAPARVDEICLFRKDDSGGGVRELPKTSEIRER